jgi:hypothetical protein
VTVTPDSVTSLAVMVITVPRPAPSITASRGPRIVSARSMVTGPV